MNWKRKIELFGNFNIFKKYRYYIPKVNCYMIKTLGMDDCEDEDERERYRNADSDSIYCGESVVFLKWLGIDTAFIESEKEFTEKGRKYADAEAI